MSHLHPSSADLTPSGGSPGARERGAHSPDLEQVRAPARRHLLTEAEIVDLRTWYRLIFGEHLQFKDPEEEENYLHGWKMQLLSHHPD
jgi:hypothetical protein